MNSNSSLIIYVVVIHFNYILSLHLIASRLGIVYRPKVYLECEVVLGFDLVGVGSNKLNWLFETDIVVLAVGCNYQPFI